MEDRNDHSDAAALLLLLLCGLIWYLYTYKYEYFVAIWWIAKWPAMQLISITPIKYLENSFLWVFWDQNYARRIQGIANFFVQYKLEDFMDIYYINEKLYEAANMDIRRYINLSNNVFSTFYIPLILILCYQYYKNINGKERHNKIYTSETLAIQESKIWPAIRPVVYEYSDMTNSKPKDPNKWFRMADSPLDYLNKNNFIIKFKKEQDDDFEKKTEYLKLNINGLYKKYVQELGERWEGIENLKFEEKAVLAIILPKIFRNVKKSNEMSDLMATYYSSYPKRINYIFTKDIIKNIFGFKFFKIMKNNKARNKILKDIKIAKNKIPKLMNEIFSDYYYKKSDKKNKKSDKKEVNPVILDYTNSHFYKKTVFIRLLTAARENGGVLATSEIIWVKKVNREFWYVLSQTGRTAAFPEISSVWSHYLAEIKVKRRMAAPFVSNAILAVDKYMFNTHGNYESFNDYDN